MFFFLPLTSGRHPPSRLCLRLRSTARVGRSTLLRKLSVACVPPPREALCSRPTTFRPSRHFPLNSQSLNRALEAQSSYGPKSPSYLFSLLVLPVIFCDNPFPLAEEFFCFFPTTPKKVPHHAGFIDNLEGPVSFQCLRFSWLTLFYFLPRSRLGYSSLQRLAPCVNLQVTSPMRQRFAGRWLVFIFRELFSSPPSSPMFSY